MRWPSCVGSRKASRSLREATKPRRRTINRIARRQKRRPRESRNPSSSRNLAMSSSQEPLRLSREDLYSPQVEAYLQDQESLRRDIPEVSPQPLLVRVIYSSYFYLSFA